MINEKIWYFTDTSRLEFQELAHSVFQMIIRWWKKLSDLGLAQELHNIFSISYMQN